MSSPQHVPAAAMPRAARPTAAIVGLVAVLFAVLAAATPAGAHGDEGEMRITRLGSTSADAIEVEVGIRYAGDGHLAEDATVEATAIGPDGRRVGPVRLDRVSGDGSLYAGELADAGPGEWTVQVASTGPVADATDTVVVPTEAVPGDADPDAADPDAADTTVAPPTIAPTVDPDAPDPAEALEEQVTLDADPMASGDDLEGGLPLVAFIGAVAAVVITGGALTVVRRRETAARHGDGPTPGA